MYIPRSPPRASPRRRSRSSRGRRSRWTSGSSCRPCSSWGSAPPSAYSSSPWRLALQMRQGRRKGRDADAWWWPLAAAQEHPLEIEFRLSSNCLRILSPKQRALEATQFRFTTTTCIAPLFWGEKELQMSDNSSRAHTPLRIITPRVGFD